MPACDLRTDLIMFAARHRCRESDKREEFRDAGPGFVRVRGRIVFSICMIVSGA